MRRFLDIHGVQCEVAGVPEALDEAVTHVVSHLGLPVRTPEAGDGPALLRFRASVGALPALPDGPPTTIHEGGYLRVWRLGDRAVLRTKTTTTEVWPEDGTAFCTVLPDSAGEQALVPELVVGFVSALFLLLRPHGFFPLHAAALAHGAHGLLLVAESDSGKSTTAFNLVRLGWDFLSDDSVLLRAGTEGVQALGFRRTFGLDVDGKVDFPELAAVEGRQPSDPAKRAVPMDALYPDQAATACRPRVLVFPTIEDRAESMLEPIAKAEALLGLAAQSALVTFRPEWTPVHLAVLSRLVNQAAAYRLHAGRDLLDDPARIVDLLATVWPGPLRSSAAAPDLLRNG